MSHVTRDAFQASQAPSQKILLRVSVDFRFLSIFPRYCKIYQQSCFRKWIGNFVNFLLRMVTRGIISGDYLFQAVKSRCPTFHSIIRSGGQVKWCNPFRDPCFHNLESPTTSRLCHVYLPGIWFFLADVTPQRFEDTRLSTRLKLKREEMLGDKFAYIHVCMYTCEHVPRPRMNLKKLYWDV